METSTSPHVTVAAIDLGASSGRVMLGRVGPARLDLTEVHRFANGPLSLPDGLHWDITGIYREIIIGLRAATAALEPKERISAIGVDSWGVDFGLIDRDGHLLGLPWCYRDGRHERGVSRANELIDSAALYQRTGLAHQPFNTIFQLAADTWPARSLDGVRALLIPDLLGYWLTGEFGAERTNTSTTGLLDVRTGQVATDLLEALGLPSGLFPQLREPGDTVGTLLPHVSAETNLPSDTPVIAVGSHDTASAVVAVPCCDETVAFISSGTWSLVGVELPAPVVTADGESANFTNEGGVDHTIRYLRNVTGLWLLQESIRQWEQETGRPVDLSDVLTQASRIPPGGPTITSDDPCWIPPGNMPERIQRACSETGQEPPTTRAEIARCIHDSLAAGHARAIADIRRLTSRRPETIHIVGGGSRNQLLAQLTADVCGVPVVAGPAEATALGNVLIQARTLGVFGSSDVALTTLRQLVHATQPLRRFEPQQRSEGTTS